MSCISVIVPVYKVEPYLDCCVKSILNQTFRDYELILVDDGSPDHCGEMCDNYAKRDPRVKVIHKENGGLSDARNAGLDAAQGKYIAFIDSDDCVHPQYLEILLTIIEKAKADIAVCHYEFFTEERTRFLEQLDAAEEQFEVLDGQRLLASFHEHCRKVSLVSQCMKLYKREIFNGLRMRVGYVQEDSLVLPYILERTGLIAKTKNKLYHWRITPGSISRSDFDKRDFDFIEVSYSWAEFFADRGSAQVGFFQRDFLHKTLHYYYKICDEKPELMEAFRCHIKRFRKMYPRYICAREIYTRERIAYTLFLLSPKMARPFYEQIYGEGKR